MAYMQTPTTSSFDYNPMQNQQMQQRLQNGTAPNGSPAPQNPMYQTQQIIPTKRPRPREDSIGASPRQYPGTLPASRSQTPQGAYPGYAGGMNGAHLQGTAPYQRFQQGTSNANQSPVMQHQSFTPQAAQQRVQTMSPSPFSPTMQNFSAQASPPHSENGSRVNTPQNGGQQYPQGMPYGVGANHPFTPPVGPGINGGPPSRYGQHAPTFQQQQQQQMMYEARMRQMHHASNGALQQRPQGSPLNPTGHPLNPNQMSALQMAQARAQHQPQAQQHPQNMQQVMQQITRFWQSKGMQFNAQPIIAGRHINGIQLFVGVSKMGGSAKVTEGGQWPNVANMLQLPQVQSAGPELQSYWNTYLAAYESYLMQQRNQQAQIQVQQQRQRAAMSESVRLPGRPQGADLALRQELFSPTQQAFDQQARLVQSPSQSQPHTQMAGKHLPPQAQPRPPMQNGYTARPHSQAPDRSPGPDGIVWEQDSAQAPAPGRSQSPKKQPADSKMTAKYFTSRKTELGEFYTPKVNILEQKLQKRVDEGKLDEANDSGEEPNLLNNIKTDSNRAIHHGGYPVLEPGFIENIDDLVKYKLSVPLVEELGPVDMRCLIMSIRSGIVGEVRLALDTMIALSMLSTPPFLDQCDDLVEALVECADDQVEFLAEHAAEVSDAMLINSYEENARGCLHENETLLESREFGTMDHDLDKAADRLICITTIFRNFSFFDTSHRSLSDPSILRTMATVIQYLGTRDMMLRSYRNTLDFSKDVVTFLTHTAHRVEFSGKDEASCILHFLVSFAPLPEPNKGNDHEVTFATYVPSLNRYLPHAVDSLAKLLARESNRTWCRSIFAADAASSPPFDLLTRVFGLAVAPVPVIEFVDPTRTITYRIPFIAHGLLAAEILVGLIPASETNLAPSWLGSRDGFAPRLLKMITILVRHSPQPQHRHAAKEISDPYGYMMVVNRGLAVLKKLAEKARDANGVVKGFSGAILPNKASVISALKSDGTDPDLVRQLCALAGLDT